MIRFACLLALASLACNPTTAEVRCGDKTCGAKQRCAPIEGVCVLDQAPVLKVGEPRVGSLVAGDTLTLSGSVHDDSGAATVELSLDDGHSWARIPVSGERFSAQVALPPMDSQPLNLSLRAHDSLQQATTTTIRITVDNLAPAVTIAAPIEGARLNLEWFSAEPKISGLATDRAGLSSLSVDLGDGEAEIAVAPIGEQFALPWAPPAGADGVERTIRVTAVDLAGNRAIVTRRVMVDVVPPQLSFTVPAADALLGPDFFHRGGQVQGWVSGAAKVMADFGYGPEAAKVSEGQWSAQYPLPAGLDFERHLLVVVAADEAGNVGRAERLTTVDVVAPVLAFTAPSQGARLNAASFLSGDKVAIHWTVNDGDPERTVHNGPSVLTGTSLDVTTSPTDNPKTYGLTLVARDRAGNSTQAQLSFDVDRVRPAVAARVPATERRNASTTVAIEFSEDVTGAAGLTLTPAAAPGRWATPRRFEIEGLAADAVFSAAVGPVVDGFGNPVIGAGPVRFHTSPALPVSGATLMTDVRRFKAAVDPDGVLTLFTTSPTTPATFRWVRVNPKSGALEDNRPAWQPVVGGDFNEVGAYAEAEVKWDLSARRISAATTLLSSTISERRAWVREADGLATSQLGLVGVVPRRALYAEGTNLAEIGSLKHSAGTVSYTRGGLGTDLLTGTGAPTAMGFASDHWELVEARSQVFKIRTFECVAPFGNAPPICGFRTVAEWTDLGADPAASYAIADRCSVVAYNSSSGKRPMKAVPYWCTGLQCPTPATLEEEQSAELKVASDRREANSFIGARRLPGGIVQLLRLPLSPSCQGTFTEVVGGRIAVPEGAMFEPVSLGGKPALLYVDSSNRLKVFAP